MEVRSRRAQKRSTGARDLSLDTSTVQQRDGSRQRLGEFISDTDSFRRTRTLRRQPSDLIHTRDLMDRVKATLSPSDQQFVHDVATHGMADVARRSGVSRRHVATKLQGIRDQFAILRAASSAAA
jgi:AraC-like DNA-binding protein